MDPETWHHALMARWWAEFNVANPTELAYYRGAVERFGQPALDLACGAGRLLVPLLAGGLDVDGVDASADMLAHRPKTGRQAWPRTPRAADGDELELFTRTSEFDALAQRRTLEMRIRLWHDGTVMVEEERSICLNLYFAQELLLMLDLVGFRDVTVDGRYTGLAATADEGTVVFVARKPG